MPAPLPSLQLLSLCVSVCASFSFTHCILLFLLLTCRDLSGNALTVLESGALVHFVRLHTLTLSRNNITEIQTGAFAGLSNLKHL